jgi:excisionase family DNA binding protein
LYQRDLPPEVPEWEHPAMTHLPDPMHSPPLRLPGLEPFVRAEEAAAFLHMSPTRLKHLARQGRIPNPSTRDGQRHRQRSSLLKRRCAGSLTEQPLRGAMFAVPCAAGVSGQHTSPAIEPQTIAETIEARTSALTVAEFCRIFSIPRATAYAWIRDGRLPAYRVGCTVRLDPAITARWLRTRQTTN